MPDSPPEEVAETGGPDLISFVDMPARLEAAGADGRWVGPATWGDAHPWG